jgi:Holliday junction resolvase RusA-like endonuclease
MIVIKGNVPSKSNCYKIIKLGNHASLAKTPNLKEFEKSFYMQLPAEWRNRNYEGLFEFEINVYYPSMRSDLDNSLKVILDCLQKTNTIANDNKCVRIVAQKFIDKDNPRCEFSIKEV